MSDKEFNELRYIISMIELERDFSKPVNKPVDKWRGRGTQKE